MLRVSTRAILHEHYANAIMKNWDDQYTKNDADSVAGLDRAIVLRTSWVRHKPHKRGGRMVKLVEGTTVALRRNCGSWWQIAYRDPLTDKIEDGWIYETLVKRIGWIAGTGRSLDNTCFLETKSMH